MLKQELVDELNILLHYNLETTLEGIKIHKDADPSVITAVQRLHKKGLTTQSDGGYLTDLGRTAAEHAQACLLILTSG
ncbi:MAG: TIGR02647 family protein [Methylomicrobium sp.]